MKTYFPLLLLIVFGLQQLGAQEVLLRISHPNKNKVVLLQEQDRIKIKTVDKKRQYGKFTIVDDKHIHVKNKVFALDSIVKIRTNRFHREITPQSIAASFVTVFSTVGFILLAFDGNSIGAWASLALIPTSLVYGTKQISNHKRKKGWTFDIVQLKPLQQNINSKSDF